MTDLPHFLPPVPIDINTPFPVAFVSSDSLDEPIGFSVTGKNCVAIATEIVRRCNLLTKDNTS